MRRRDFLKLCGYGLAATAVPGVLRAADEGAPKRPNIILFMVDDMGWQDTSVPFWYVDGKPVKTRLNTRYRTPNMEAMAKDGVLFTQAYACPVCSPTRCSLMSGMNMARHRVTDWTLGVDQQNRLTSNGEGCYPPVWAANGLQPEGTTASGRCLQPWKLDGNGKFYQPQTGAEVDYSMSAPFTNALAFPKLLQKEGYFTVHCGKAHWGSGGVSDQTSSFRSTTTTPGADPRNFGFDVNIAGSEIGGPTSYRADNKYGNASNARFAVPGMDENNYYSENVFLTDALTDRTLETLEAHLAGENPKPFYLYMAHYVIHAPWANANAWDSSRSDSTTVASDTKNPNPGDALTWNETERNYSVLIKGMDDSLGAIRKFLLDKGIADNTIVIFMSDNGGHEGSAGSRMTWSNAPLRAGKGSCYEGGIREPMMVVWPGVVTGGTVCHEPVHIDDFYPTILDMAGVPLPTEDELAVTPEGVYKDGPVKQVLDGQSIVPLLRGERETVSADGSPRAFLWHYPNKWGEGYDNRNFNFYSVVRQGDWKLIYNHNTAGGAETFELYNIPEDISEKTNLASVYPDITNRLRRLLAERLRACGAQMPTRTADGATVPWPDEVAWDATARPQAGVTLKGAAGGAQ